MSLETVTVNWQRGSNVEAGIDYAGRISDLFVLVGWIWNPEGRTHSWSISGREASRVLPRVTFRRADLSEKLGGGDNEQLGVLEFFGADDCVAAEDDASSHTKIALAFGGDSGPETLGFQLPAGATFEQILIADVLPSLDDATLDGANTRELLSRFSTEGKLRATSLLMRRGAPSAQGLLAEFEESDAFSKLTTTDQKLAALELLLSQLVQRAEPYRDPALLARVEQIVGSVVTAPPPAASIPQELLDGLLAVGFRDHAIMLAEHIVRNVALPPPVLYGMLKGYLPKYSVWWLHSCLNNQYLGPREMSGALQNVSAAMLLQGDGLLAELFMSAAKAVGPESETASFSIGNIKLGRGKVIEAFQSFERVHRAYTSEEPVAMWPQQGRNRWPDFQVNHDDFAAALNVPAWPRITIITPSYNQGRYIEDTIRSVVNQNYPNLQYLVIDGGSTDETLSIIEKYRDRIDHYVSEPDRGQSHALNKGFALADGELLGWINSDDMLAPGALHVAAYSLLRSGADIIAGACVEHS